ncbi:MAG: MFS transporter [Bernardetiaceae bacterium]|jgi:MFS family permease|nr:MFS transporter [Bernardetiaceae bacterium]
MPPPPDAPRYSPVYAWGVVGLLMVAYIFSFVDRYVLNLLVAPLKQHFSLSDTQVSLLMGASFAMFYATLGLPIGRLVDRASRRNIIAGGVALWSLMTALCGLAQSYGQLFWARVGVGVGEAALSPAAYSLLADYFPKQRLATALSVYSIGIYLGTGAAYLGGGYLLEWLLPLPPSQWAGLTVPAWQWLFVIVGLPGLLVAALVWLLVREPRRHQPVGPVPSLAESWRRLGQPAGVFWWLLAGSALFTVVSYGAGTWLPTYLMRVHQLPFAQASRWVGLASMLAAPLGLLMGGRLADYWTSRGHGDAKFKLCFGVAVVFLPINLGYNAMPNLPLTLAALAVFLVVLSSAVGVTAAAVQELVPPPLRGFAAAVLLFAQNAVGLSLGPTVPALLNDYVFGSDQALGRSLVLTAVVALTASAACFWVAWRRFNQRNPQVDPNIDP